MKTNDELMRLLDKSLERVARAKVPVTLHLSPEQMKSLTATGGWLRSIFSAAQIRQIEEAREDLMTAAEVEFYMENADFFGPKMERLMASHQTALSANELEAAFPMEQREYLDDLVRRWKRLETKNDVKTKKFVAWSMSTQV